MIELKIQSSQKYWKLQSWARDLLSSHDECVICGANEKLVPHHIIKCENTNPIYFSQDNGVVMCHSCHRLYHRKYSDVNAHTFIKFSQKYSTKLKRKNKMKS